MTLSTRQITAQLERVLSSDAKALTVAMQAAARQPWPEWLPLGGRRFVLRWCESSLAIREALCDIEQQDPASAGLVVITPLATHEVAEDIAARLARRRVYPPPEGWDLVRDLFQAKDTDARLGRHAWMPAVLMAAAEQAPYDPVANGFLDLETAWRAVLQRLVGFASARPDAVALLQWSLVAGAEGRLQSLPAPARVDLARWLSDAAGAVGALVWACVEAGRAADALALGFVWGVVVAPAGAGQVALGQAAIRLERFVGDAHVGVDAGRAWAQAAEHALPGVQPAVQRAVLDRADALLQDLRIGSYAHLSDWLPIGQDQRMLELAEALSRHAAAPTTPHLDAVERLADRVLAHKQGNRQVQRMDSVAMARRLARWLMGPAPPGSPLASAAAWQADEGAFVDWARFQLLGGDELAELSAAYRALRAAVAARRQTFDQQFAQALQQWHAQPPGRAGRLLPVEAVLDQVLAPLAARHPVLLLVMDGLSTSIHRELFADLAGLGWAEWVPAVPAGAAQPLVAVAALPTVTEVSRASLLCGRLCRGASAQEKTGFASHAALLANSRSDLPPRLFHKGELAEAGNLSQQVREALALPQQKVVGVVFNAVDDHLSGPDQSHQRWALEHLHLLLPLLREARDARRVVVITADHGHVLEDASAALSPPAGDADMADKRPDRWRPGTQARTPHEVVCTGSRVLAGDGGQAVICLWGENTRYGGRKKGYHGGVSPQEVTVPLSVIAPSGINLAGWELALPAQPEWWELRLPCVPLAAAPPPAPALVSRAAAHRGAESVRQSSLFDPDEAPLPASAVAAHDWIAAVLGSSIYASQRQLAARVALPDDRMRVLLASLSERGGKLSRAALAQRLALPEVRLGGLLSAARRMLNVDQAPVLSVDESAGIIELNRALLLQQFQASAGGGAR